ncbi:unnamed protein product, partial [Pleuronectes platessa]
PHSTSDTELGIEIEARSNSGKRRKTQSKRKKKKQSWPKNPSKSEKRPEQYKKQKLQTEQHTRHGKMNLPPNHTYMNTKSGPATRGSSCVRHAVLGDTKKKQKQSKTIRRKAKKECKGQAEESDTRSAIRSQNRVHRCWGQMGVTRESSLSLIRSQRPAVPDLRNTTTTLQQQSATPSAPRPPALSLLLLAAEVFGRLKYAHRPRRDSPLNVRDRATVNVSPDAFPDPTNIHECGYGGMMYAMSASAHVQHSSESEARAAHITYLYGSIRQTVTSSQQCPQQMVLDQILEAGRRGRLATSALSRRGEQPSVRTSGPSSASSARRIALRPGQADSGDIGAETDCCP